MSPKQPSTRKLNLYRMQLGNEGAIRLAADVLPHCPKLELLYLEGNGIGDEGATALAEALPHCPTLRALDLQDNEGIGDAGVAALVEALPPHPTVVMRRRPKQQNELFAIVILLECETVLHR